MNVFEHTLSLWVALCMVAGIVLGKILPTVVDFRGKMRRIYQFARIRQRRRSNSGCSLRAASQEEFRFQLGIA